MATLAVKGSGTTARVLADWRRLVILNTQAVSMPILTPIESKL